MVRRASIVALVLCVLASEPAAAGAEQGSPDVAALQVALARRGVYGGPIDGRDDARTAAAVRRFQARRRLVVDGIAGPRTRAALGRWARHRLGSRPLVRGEAGWDVAELQFALAWAGFPSGVFDGRFGFHLLGALRRFQRSRGLAVDGIAGARTLAALRDPPGRRSAVRLAWPVAHAQLGDRFGPRGRRFHAGVDLVVPEGVPVTAAAPGRVAWAAARAGWGLLVVVAHRGGIRTFYAHLSAIAVTLGERVRTGTRLGRVGATGDATGPHLHFEVREDGAAVDPLRFLAPR